jgi:hypothetical protein
MKFVFHTQPRTQIFNRVTLKEVAYNNVANESIKAGQK